MEAYKWYKAEEILPEETNLPRNNNGMEGFFIVALKNGDLWCVTRWLDNNHWYWDADSEMYDKIIEQDGITHWMIIVSPKI